MPIKGKGTVPVMWGKSSITLDNCLFVPDIVINLISAGELDSKSCTFHSENSKFTVSRDGKVSLKGTVKNGMYSVNNLTSVGALKIQSRKYRDLFQCKSCVLAKITKQSFKAESKIVDKPFECLHLDLVGPIKPESSLKHCFILSVVDNHLVYLAGFPLVHKEDTTDVLITLLENEKVRRGYFPMMICSDGGGEFIGNRVVSFLNKNHIQRLISEPHHPEHNGRAERANKTIVESIYATLDCSKICKRFWHEVLKSFCIGLNQIPQRGQSISPWEILHGKPFPTNLLRPIGTPAIILNMTRVKGRKFNSKGEEGQFLGYNVPLHSYRLVTQSGRVVKAKHVRFLKRVDQHHRIDLDNEIQFFPEEESQLEPLPQPVNPTPAVDHRGNDHVAT
ncbi:hypothetical protein VP01_2480g2 [Puccinia sorghi]|uniref:Integrase catalytic domain-containing protein n=1 Tax=Puccinia sorghi TaxID=27349 RepID=A0A0L6V5S9_9BASI|nr:hypothetical protein VP01_2480g2 [Puccinia sorghi]